MALGDGIAPWLFTSLERYVLVLYVWLYKCIVVGVHKKYSHPERVIASRGNNVERRSWDGGSPYSGTSIISCIYLRLFISNTLQKPAVECGQTCMKKD